MQCACAVRPGPDPVHSHSGARERAVEAPADHHVVFYKKNAHLLAAVFSALLLARCLSTLLALCMAEQTSTPGCRRLRTQFRRKQESIVELALNEGQRKIVGSHCRWVFRQSMCGDERRPSQG